MATQSQINESINQFFFAKVKIKNLEIIPRNIVNVTIREWIFEQLPRIEIILNDDGMLTELYSIEDNDEIYIEIAKNDQIEKDQIIKSTFLVNDYQLGMVGDNHNNLLYITGILKVDNLLYPIKTKAFHRKTSKQVISEIASETGKEFLPGQNFSTSDIMTWYQIHSNNLSFIKHVLERSYKQQDLMICYYTLDDKLKYTSLYTELNKDTIIPAKYDPTKFALDAFEDDNDKEILWFNNISFTNLMGTYNKTNSYTQAYTYYNLENHVEETYSDNRHTFTSHGWKKNSEKDKIVLHSDYGFLTNNVHSNYYKSMIQNNYLLKNFFVFTVTINVNSLQRIKLCDIVNLYYPALYDVGTRMNESLSGKYIVSGIVYSAGKDSIFEKSVILQRNGFNNATLQRSYGSI